MPEGVRGVLTPAAAAGDAWRFSHVRYQASPDLAPYVEHYWSVSWDLVGQPPHTVETLPHPSVHMVFDHSGEARIAGVAKGKFVRRLEGKNGVFGVKFRPGGFHPFLRAPVSSLTDRTVSLGSVFGEAGEALVVAMREAIDDVSRAGVANAFLQSRAVAEDATVAWIAEVTYAVAKDRKILKVEDLVSLYGVNKRTPQRLFAKYVGASPKWVIQRYRLHEAAAQLAAAEGMSHSMLAADLGYSDQAHFARDFKAMVGASPRAFAKRS